MNRPHTSESKVKDLRRPDRRTAMKVLVNKTFGFVDHLWAVYVHNNKADLRCVRHIHVRHSTFFVLFCSIVTDEVIEDYDVVEEVPGFEDVIDDGQLIPLDPLDDEDPLDDDAT